MLPSFVSKPFELSDEESEENIFAKNPGALSPISRGVNSFVFEEDLIPKNSLFLKKKNPATKSSTTRIIVMIMIFLFLELFCIFLYNIIINYLL